MLLSFGPKRMLSWIYRGARSRRRRMEPARISMTRPAAEIRLERLEPRLLLSVDELVGSLNTTDPVAARAIPLSFQPAAAQNVASQNYISRGFGYQFDFAATQASMRLSGAVPADDDPGGVHNSEANITMRWLGGNADATVSAAGLASHVTHYLIGDDPHQWRVNVPNYDRLLYHEIYDGVDLAFYGGAGELEYDWLVSPGADPRQIVMSFEGIDGIHVDEAGQLVMSTAYGELHQRAPRLYQKIDGVVVAVEGAFAINTDGTVGFDVGAYDISYELVIDPRVIFSIAIGGDVFDGAEAVEVDDDGNTYVTGRTGSSDFPTTHDAFQQNRADTNAGDAWIGKFDTNGNLVWISLFGGSGSDLGLGIGVNSAGEIWIAGETGSPDLPLMNPLQNSLGGSGDAFVARISNDGSELLSSTYLGGSGADFANDLAVGANDTVYLTGASSAGGMPRVNEIVDFIGGSSPGDAFVTQLSPNGQDVLFSTYYASDGGEAGESIAVDHLGNIYIAGWTGGTLPTPNGLQSGAPGSVDAFLAKIDPVNAVLLYATALHGTGSGPGQLETEFAFGVDVYGDGLAAVVGLASSPGMLTTPNAVKPSAPTVGDLSRNNANEGFLTVIDTTKSGQDSLVYGTYFGSEQFSEHATGVRFDQFGNVILVGHTGSQLGFPITPEALQPVYGGPTGTALTVGDSFIAKINPFTTSDTLLYSSYFGSGAHDQLNDVAVNDAGEVVVVGESGAAFSQFWNAIVSKYDLSTDHSWARTHGFHVEAYEPIADVVGSFFTTRDGAVAEDFDVNILWGDGHSTAASVLNDLGSGNFDVPAAHAYTQHGAYPVTMTVEDSVKGDARPTHVNNASLESGSQFAPVLARSGIATFMIAAQTSFGSGLVTGLRNGNKWERGTFGGAGSELGNPDGYYDAVFDSAGDLWVAYSADGQLSIARSKDLGNTFESVTSFNGARMGPASGRISIATGPLDQGSSADSRAIWVVYQDLLGEIYVTNTAILGPAPFAFSEPESVGGPFAPVTLQLPDIAVGPDGQAIVVWQRDDGIFSSLAGVVYESTISGVVSGFIETHQPFRSLREDGMHPSIVFDHSPGEHRGRAYIAYQGEFLDFDSGTMNSVFGLDTLLIHSEDGTDWSDPKRVNQDQADKRQIAPSIAVDQDTGNVALGWYDARNSSNDDTFEFYVAATNDGGDTFVSEVALTAEPIVDSLLLSQTSLVYYNDFFDRGTLEAAWADDASNLGLPRDLSLDIATASIGIMDVARAPVSITPLGFDAIEKQAGDALVATFTTPDPNAAPGQFRATIYWGDNSATPDVPVTQPDGPGTSFHVRGNHAYLTEGVYPLRVEVHQGGRTYSSIANTTKKSSSQSSGTIAVDPNALNRVFVAAEDLDFRQRETIVVSVSDDGGETWTRRNIGGTDGLPELIGHPRAVYDDFGNLYLVATSRDDDGLTRTAILTSIDGGQRFDMVGQFDAPFATEPAIAVGPDASGMGQTVWVTHTVREANGNDNLLVDAFQVTGLGQFGEVRTVVYASALFGSVGDSDLAIGPDGQVLATWVESVLNNVSIFTSINPDGLGPMPFDLPELVDDTFAAGVAAEFFSVPQQPSRGITPSPRVAWDRSFGPNRGRAYIAYTINDGSAAPNTQVVVRYSDDQGLSWSDPVLLPFIPGENEFNPAIAVDPDSGAVAVSFLKGQVGLPSSVGRHVIVSGNGSDFFLAKTTSTFQFKKPANFIHPQADYNEANPPGSTARIESGDFGEMVFVDDSLHVAWPTNSLDLTGNPRPADLEIADWKIGVADVYGVPLEIAFVDEIEAFEGELIKGVLANFRDPDLRLQSVDDYVATIDWGDGTQTLGEVFLDDDGTYGIEVEKIYDTVGAHDLSIFIQGQRAATFAATMATIEPAPLLAKNQLVRVVEDVEFSEVVAQFTTDNFFAIARNFRATIDWGDDNSSPGVVEFDGIQGDLLVFNVIGTHTYDAEQPHTVIVTIEQLPSRSRPTQPGPLAADGDQPIQSVVANSTVIAGDPVISVGTVAEVGALEDFSTGDVTLAIFQLGEGPIDTHAGAYAATIDWDDGTTSDGEVNIVDDRVTVRGEHAYVDGGVFAPTVTLVDDSGGSGIATAIMVVARNITTVVNVNASGLVFNPATQTYVGNVQVFNNSGVNLTGDFRIAFDDLTPGATLLTATDTTLAGDPYVKVDQGILFSGNALPAAPLEFSVPDPLNATISYTPRVYAGGQFLGSSLDPNQQQAIIGRRTPGFEQNIGQVDDAVRFLSRGAGYVIYLRDSGAVVRLDGSDRPVTLGMNWVGGNPESASVGIERLGGVSHYLIGDDPSQWLTDISTFGRVRFTDVYDGIDIELHRDSGLFQYDWYVDAGANPGDIVLSFDGADDVSLEADGSLRVVVDGESMVHHTPTLYQTIAGDLMPVPGGYVLLGDGHVGFDVGNYHATQQLVIDPVLEYTSYYGGDFIDTGADIAVDADGNTIVVGGARSVNFPTVNAIDDTHTGDGFGFADGFIAKIDPDRNVLFSTFLGSTPITDGITSVAIDRDNNIVVAGVAGFGFPTTPDAFQPEFGGSAQFFGGDGFFAKLDASGANILYASYLGGGGADGVSDLAMDDAGNVYLVGNTDSLSFPTTDGVVQDEHADPRDPFIGTASRKDGFITRVNADGTLGYSTLLGGLGDDFLLAVDVDNTGRAHVAGYTQADGLPTPGGPNASNRGDQDAYVAILSADASSVEYGTYLGGTGDDRAADLLVDETGRIRVVGYTESSDFEVANSLQNYSGARDAFIATIDNTGALVQSTFYGTEGDDLASAVGVDAAGNTYVVGEVGSASFNTVDAVQPNYGGDTDAFVTRFDAEVRNIDYATFLGGNGVDRLSGLFVEADGTASVVGTTLSTNLRAIHATQPGLAPGGFLREDVMIARIAPAGMGQIEVAAQSFDAVEGRPFDGLVGTFTTTSSDEADAFTATIDWGDGTVTPGVVTKTGNGFFDVAGMHVYEQFGTYPVGVTVEHEDGTIVTTMRSTAAVAAAQGFIDYRMSIDVAGLAGTDGVLSFQFNPALLGGSTPGLATVSNVSLDGGVLGGGPVTEGGASGAVDDVVTIGNGGQLNRLSQLMTFGDVITFDLRLSGDMLTDPIGGLFSSTFSVQLLGDSGVTPLLTTDASGAVLSIDVLSDGSTQAMTYEDATGVRAATVATGQYANVIDGSLEAAAVPVAALEGVLFNGVVATITDENPFGTADEFTATIDWGDGTQTTLGTVVQAGVGTFDVIGSHLYAQIGSYDVTTTIDSIGGFSTETKAVTGGIAGLQAARTQQIGGNPSHMDSGDFDKDGNLDIVVPAYQAGDHALVLFGKGDGTFEDPLEVPADNRPFDLTIGDFNNDGHLDLITTSFTIYTVVLGNGDRTFQAPVTHALQGINQLFTTDLNHDGVLDMVVSTFVAFVGPGIVPLLGNGDGTFTALPAFSTTNRAGAFDVDGDGNADIVEASNDGTNQTFTIRYGNGDGTFASPVDLTIPVVGNAAFGDMNGDDIFDIVVNSSGMTHVLFGDGMGQYGAPMSVNSHIDTAVIRLVDFEGDGDLDVVAPRGGSGTLGGVDLMLNDGTGVLTDAVEYPAPARHRDYTIGDFDNNGVNDVAGIHDTPLSNAAMLTVALGNEDGSIVAPLRFNLEQIDSDISRVADWAVADLNQDGHFDMTIFTLGRSRRVYSILNQGDGRFGDAIEVSGVFLPSELALADVNNDTFPDLIYTEDADTIFGLPEEEEGVYIRLGNGDGTFGAENFYQITRNPVSLSILRLGHLAVGDLNGDGHADLFVVAGHHSKILLGNGDGTFQTPTQLLVGGSTTFAPVRVELMDFNNDGKLDFASRGVFVALGNGDGTFGFATRFDSSTGDSDFRIGDVNRDGKPDIVTSSSQGAAGEPGAIRVLLGDGAGRFSDALEYGATASAYDFVVLADFNADGSLDVAVLGGGDLIHATAAGLSVLFNNGDGTYGEPLLYEPGETYGQLMTTGLFDDDLIPDIIVAPANQTMLVITSKVAAGGANVENAPLNVTAYDMNPVAGVAFTTNVAAFTDDDTLAVLGDHTATIDWGDGNATDGVVIASPVGGFLVQGTHTYASDGSFDVTVTVNDDVGGSAEGLSTADVTGADGVVTASPVVFDAREGVLFTGVTATFTDSDPLGALGDYTALIQWGDGEASEGAIAINGNDFEVIGSHTYAAGGVFDVTVTISDIGGGDVAVSTANVEGNLAPTAVDDDYTVDEDQSLIVGATSGVLPNDEDLDGDTLTVILDDTVDHGTLTLNPDGSFTYSPNENFNGVDGFSYLSEDGRGGSVTGTATITVLPANDAPAGVDDGAATDEETAVIIHVLANDSDVDGDALIVLRTTDPAFGTVMVNADQSITYAPNTHFHGTDTFTYTAFDNADGVAVASVEVDVLPVNDEPLARDDLAATLEDTSVVVDVLSNDFDADGDELSVIDTSQPANGMVVANPDGTVAYIPDPEFHGSVTFTYTINDGVNGVAIVGNVTVAVTAVNDAPIAVGDAYETAEDTALSVDTANGVLSNDDDPDGEPQSAILVSDVGHGVLRLNADGSFNYTPDANYHGPDGFKYRTVDAGGARSESVAVALTVTPVNDDPVTQDDTATTAENVAISVNVLSNDTDADGDELTVVSVSQSGKGAVMNAGDGTLIYTPNPGENGIDTFSYTVDDGHDGRAVAIVTVTINPLVVNAAPQANDDEAVTDPGIPVDIGVLADDRDPDGSLSVNSLSVVSHPVNGSAAVNRNGTITYLPDDGFAGADRFTYVVADDDGVNSNEASVTVTVRSLVGIEAIATDATEEGSRDGSFLISRSGMTTGTLTVHYNVVGTAANGDDYELLQGEAIIMDGDPSVTVLVSPIDDGHVEEVETVSLLLATSAAYVVDRSQSYDTVNIVDNDDKTYEPGIVVTPITELTTSEDGGTAQFSVVLTAPPTDEVIVKIYSTDPSEGMLSSGRLTFTADDWDQPQTVTVSGVDDDLVDGDVGFAAVTAWAVSLDERYHGINPDDVEYTNRDDETVAAQAAFVAYSGWPEQFVNWYVANDVESSQYGFEVSTSKGQVSSVAWPQMDMLSIIGSGDRMITEAWLQLTTGGDTPTPGVSGFQFDTDTHTATWRFDGPIRPGLHSVAFGPPDQLLDPSIQSVSRFEIHFLPGDVDHDLDVDAGDIDVLEAAKRSDAYDPIKDLNADGTNDHDDTETLVSEIIGTTFGDVDLDGFVDSRDVAIWKRFRFSEQTGWASADVNGDEMTDVHDFNVILANRTTGQAMADIAHPRGDINLDGLLTPNDVDVLQDTAKTRQMLRRGDLDSNGTIDGADVEALVVDEFHSRPGDANLDGRVDGLDFTIWTRNRFLFETFWSTGDFTSDGRTHVDDFYLWMENRFFTSTLSSDYDASRVGKIPRAPLAKAATVVPELWGFALVSKTAVSDRHWDGRAQPSRTSDAQIIFAVDKFFLRSNPQREELNRYVYIEQPVQWSCTMRRTGQTSDEEATERIDAYFALDDSVADENGLFGS